MSFSGATNVIHVSKNGTSGGTGISWSTAVDGLSTALSKFTSAGGLVLVAPGTYLDSKAQATIGVDNIRIEGVGPGVVFAVNTAQHVIQSERSGIEIVNLTLWNKSSDASAAAFKSSASSVVLTNITFEGCLLRGKTAAKLTAVQGLRIQSCMLEGELSALSMGKLSTAEASLYSCVASNSDFRAVNPANTNAAAVIVDGGNFVGLNCNILSVASAASPSSEYCGASIANNGEILCTNCSFISRRASGSGGSTHFGVKLAGSTTRIKLTGCTVVARDGATNQSISPNPGTAARMQVDATLLSPAWSAT